GNYIKRSSHDVLNISMPPLQVYADDNVLESAGARNADSWNLFKHPGASDDGWESRARIAVSKSDEAWTAEMAIPFEAFSEKPRLGDKWRFNAARTDLTKRGHLGSTWAPIVCGEFLQPGVFQPLAFRSEFPPAGRSVSFLGRDAADEATLTCVRTQKAPDLNGRLNDGAWKNAARATGFLLVGVYPEGLRAAPNQSKTFLCHDADHLYLGIRCELSPEFPPEVHVRKDGGPVWEDECVELFFDPHPAVPDDYYQVIVNPLGALFDTHHMPREIPESVRAETPFAVPRVATDSASEAYDKVLASAGATLPQRDEVDERIVRQVREGSGGFIATQDDVGGWPNLSSDAPPADSDRDGMPDAWELKHGLDPNDAADAAEDSDGDVYTNIEEYLNGTRP
ncbi:MAG: hypothetical protein R6V12_11780, partial [Candidatus Hydrogenedentota bacterium]